MKYLYKFDEDQNSIFLVFNREKEYDSESHRLHGKIVTLCNYDIELSDHIIDIADFIDLEIENEHILVFVRSDIDDFYFKIKSKDKKKLNLFDDYEYI